jgi:chemotaxis signal transduction protein
MKDDKARQFGSEETPEGGVSPARQTALTAGLECRVGKAPIVVPVEHVVQIIEYEMSPLPLTRRWITGVGLHDGRLVMTVGLVADGVARPRTERRRTKGVLLTLDRADQQHDKASKVSWALEVQEVLVLVQAEVIDQKRGIPRVGDLPAWIARARTNDGRSLGWIDVPAMLSDLTSPPRSFA